MGPPPTNLIPLEIPSSHEDGAPEILRPLPSSFFSSPSSRTHSFHLSPLPPPLPYLPFLFSSSSFLFFSTLSYYYSPFSIFPSSLFLFARPPRPEPATLLLFYDRDARERGLRGESHHSWLSKGAARNGVKGIANCLCIIRGQTNRKMGFLHERVIVRIFTRRFTIDPSFEASFSYRETFCVILTDYQNYK